MPELHIIGELEGAAGFSSSNLFCKWKIVVEDEVHWSVLEGTTEGQTQVDLPAVMVLMVIKLNGF